MYAYGDNSVPIRVTRELDMTKDNWALCGMSIKECAIDVLDNKGILTNGKIKVEISRLGKLTVYNQKNKLILEEYVSGRKDLLDEKLEVREFKSIIGGDYHVIVHFESKDPDEKIHGMGQYQQPFMNIKGTDLELAHRNS